MPMDRTITKENAKHLLQHTKVTTTRKQNLALQRMLRNLGFEWIDCTETDPYPDMPYIFIHEDHVSFSGLKEVYDRIEYKEMDIQEIFTMTIEGI